MAFLGVERYLLLLARRLDRHLFNVPNPPSSRVRIDHHPGASILAYCLSSISMTVVNKYVVSGSSWNLNFFYLAVQVRVRRRDSRCRDARVHRGAARPVADLGSPGHRVHSSHHDAYHGVGQNVNGQAAICGMDEPLHAVVGCFKVGLFHVCQASSEDRLEFATRKSSVLVDTPNSGEEKGSRIAQPRVVFTDSKGGTPSVSGEPIDSLRPLAAGI